jgi:hypothetical protein
MVDSGAIAIVDLAINNNADPIKRRTEFQAETFFQVPFSSFQL